MVELDNGQIAQCDGEDRLATPPISRLEPVRTENRATGYSFDLGAIVRIGRYLFRERYWQHGIHQGTIAVGLFLPPRSSITASDI